MEEIREPTIPVPYMKVMAAFTSLLDQDNRSRIKLPTTVDQLVWISFGSTALGKVRGENKIFIFLWFSYLR